MPKISRREFLVAAGAAGVGLALPGRPAQVAHAIHATLESTAAPSNRVVHTHCSDATFWDYSRGWYGDYVNQAVVDTMTDLGLFDLTNTATLADAWHKLIPGYAASQKIAIKINLNNADCGDTDQVIDGLPHPVNSVIRGLKAIGVSESDICVYDATNGWHVGEMPARFVAKVTALYPNVQFHSQGGGCSTEIGYSSTERIHFNVPPGSAPINDLPICNVLANASYLINIPIMKKHGMAGVTLGFKNHFGSIDRCDLVHWSVDLGDGGYTPAYSGLVDIYNNTHFKNKTVLVLGDGLYGARIDNYSEVPSAWPTFGQRSPNSLFFSRDPVAIDCVMYDFLDAEEGVPSGSDNYLKLASSSGLGSFEHWDAAHQYRTIDYRRIEVALTLTRRAYLPNLDRLY